MRDAEQIYAMALAAKIRLLHVKCQGVVSAVSLSELICRILGVVGIRGVKY